jgi:hypothetical protein
MIELFLKVWLPLLMIGIVTLVCRRVSWPLAGAATTELALPEAVE